MKKINRKVAKRLEMAINMLIHEGVFGALFSSCYGSDVNYQIHTLTGFSKIELVVSAKAGTQKPSRTWQDERSRPGRAIGQPPSASWFLVETVQALGEPFCGFAWIPHRCFNDCSSGFSSSFSQIFLVAGFSCGWPPPRALSHAVKSQASVKTLGFSPGACCLPLCGSHLTFGTHPSRPYGAEGVGPLWSCIDLSHVTHTKLRHQSSTWI